MVQPEVGSLAGCTGLRPRLASGIQLALTKGEPPRSKQQSNVHRSEDAARKKPRLHRGDKDNEVSAGVSATGHGEQGWACRAGQPSARRALWVGFYKS